MSAEALLTRLERLGVLLRVDGSDLRVRAPMGAWTPELRAELAVHKPELMALLRKPLDSAQSKPAVVDAPTAWHANEVAHQVEAEGICVFWADVLGGMVAFVRDDADLAHVPAGIVTFTSAELAQLFPDGEDGPSVRALRLLYEGKRLGGNGKVHRE